MTKTHSTLQGEDAELVAQELRRRADRRGMAKRLAYEIGISEAAVYKVIAGTRPPSYRMARALGFKLERIQP